jgi:hypothetical protein
MPMSSFGPHRYHPKHLLAGILAAGFIAQWGVVAFNQPTFAQSTLQSRLNRLVQDKPTLYLPTQLVIGHDNTFTVKAPAGHKVMLYLSTEPEGFSLAETHPLRVGPEHQVYQAEVPEKGVVKITVPVPDDKEYEGRIVFVDAVTWHEADYTDLQHVVMMGPQGYKTDDNRISMALPATKSGVIAMPSMPGMSAQMMQQLNTATSALSGDLKAKALLDNGDLSNDDSDLHKNVFINRTGGFWQNPTGQR